MKDPSSRASRMEKLLQERFAPLELAVRDDSANHAGHGGARPEGETHFHVRLVSGAFAGKSRIDRQRLVHEALRQEFESGLHALALQLKAPGES